MAKHADFDQQFFSLADIGLYHSDAEAALRLFYTPASPDFVRFIGHSASEIRKELDERLGETEIRSVFVILARLEAAFRKDYKDRCRSKMPDAISVSFRALYKKWRLRARLEDDIFQIWKQNTDPDTRKIIGDLQGAFKYRHWLAHGRQTKFGNHKYDYLSIYILASKILGIFSLNPG